MKGKKFAEIIVRSVLTAAVYMLLKEAYTALTEKGRHMEGAGSGSEGSVSPEKAE